MRCPRCGRDNIRVEMFQEDHAVKSVTKTTSKYREQRKGCLWWFVIGWWWWIIELLLWVLFFVPMALIRIGRKKKYKGNYKSTTQTSYETNYRKIFLCNECGNSWEEY